MKGDIDRQVSWRGKFGFGNAKSQINTESRIKRQTEETGSNHNSLANLGEAT